MNLASHCLWLSTASGNRQQQTATDSSKQQLAAADSGKRQERIIDNSLVGNGQWELEQYPAFVAHFRAGYISNSYGLFNIVSLHNGTK